MNSNWNHAISLISYNKAKDKDGFEVTNEIVSDPIFANFKSVTRAEEEHSKKLGYNADLIIEIMAVDYNNEETLKDIDTQKKYAIKRTFAISSEILQLTATDLRSGAALVTAGLIAEGTTIINDADYILRGYERIITKLSDVGAKIEITEI